MYVCVTQQLAQMFMENIKVGLQNVLAAQRADEEEEGEGKGEEGCREEEERDGEEGGGKGEEERGSVLAGVVLCLHKKTNAQYGGQLNTLHCVCVHVYICTGIHCTLYPSPTRGSSYFLGFPWVCCVALPCCLFVLVASFFLPSHLSLKYVHVYMYIVHVLPSVHI